MPNTRIREAAAKAVNLIPFDAGSLKGDYAAVCTPPETVPYALRPGQIARTKHYMATSDRSGPGSAPRYYLTTRGHLIAHVTMDGTVHYAILTGSKLGNRHQAMIRAAWPTRFTPFAN